MNYFNMSDINVKNMPIFKEKQKLADQLMKLQQCEKNPKLFAKNLVVLIDIIKNVDISQSSDLFCRLICLACKLSLVKTIPTSLASATKSLIGKLFQDVPKSWEGDIEIMKNVSKSLFELSAKEEFTVIYIIEHISYYNIFSYLVSVMLVWSSLFHLIGDDESKMFSLHEFSEILRILNQQDIQRIAQDYDYALRFLSLISIFQQLIILNSAQYVSGNLGKYFEFDRIQDVKPIETWLLKLKNNLNISEMESIFFTDIKILEVIELLNLTILPAFDSDV